MTETRRSTRATAIAAETLGEAWLRVAEAILEAGAPSRYDDLPITELERVTLDVARPDPEDPVIAELADPERLAWMRANFADPARVAELGNARSYASRLFDYAGAGRDQINWVIQRLRDDPLTRSAAITTFEPLLDTTYIPCVSLLDFWIRDSAVELAELHRLVAEGTGHSVGPLVFIVKSAHVYDRDLAYMRGVLSQQRKPTN